ncbi:hypothetical protein VII00023_09069 [Vibrio ichthyoenteri ATCC 700023]|uniref:Uncharacterized protein n=1 Tax=Vibrio ichthyoenteri ATCC 700023 TaxID=870968 RepID=F9S8R3_9VIBR|nr:hypothetical protein [Vibrio ichthyoenteri]EGU29550.1 hypothetical protein VII00023_09069 [Vibrio ichthyoenteri ATCC 700023]
MQNSKFKDGLKMVAITVAGLVIFNVMAVMMGFVTFYLCEDVFNVYGDEAPIGSAAFIAGVVCVLFISGRVAAHYQQAASAQTLFLTASLLYLAIIFIVRHIVISFSFDQLANTITIAQSLVYFFLFAYISLKHRNVNAQPRQLS